MTNYGPKLGVENIYRLLNTLKISLLKKSYFKKFIKI